MQPLFGMEAIIIFGMFLMKPTVAPPHRKKDDSRKLNLHLAMEQVACGRKRLEMFGGEKSKDFSLSRTPSSDSINFDIYRTS
jgi:hypothetical protein